MKLGGTSPLFLCYNDGASTTTMDREKVKFLIQSIEVLIDELKAEVYTSDETYKISETDYSDEVKEVSTDDLVRNMFSQVTDDLDL